MTDKEWALSQTAKGRTVTIYCQKPGHGSTPGYVCAACYKEANPDALTLKVWALESRILALEVKG